MGDVFSSNGESFNEVFDKVWPQTPESSSASVAFCSLDDGLYLHETDGQDPLEPTRNSSKLQLDKGRRSFPTFGRLSSSSSRSIMQFNIDEEKDRELTPLESVGDELIVFRNKSMKDQITRESKEG